MDWEKEVGRVVIKTARGFLIGVLAGCFISGAVLFFGTIIISEEMVRSNPLKSVEALRFLAFNVPLACLVIGTFLGLLSGLFISKPNKEGSNPTSSR